MQETVNVLKCTVYVKPDSFPNTLHPQTTAHNEETRF